MRGFRVALTLAAWMGIVPAVANAQSAPEEPAVSDEQAPSDTGGAPVDEGTGDDVAADEAAAPEEGAPEATEAEVPAPPPPAPAPAPAAAPFPLRATGTLWAMIIGTNGVQTFAWPNASAITAAANPALVGAPDDAYLSFQVQQTRVGLVAGEGTDVLGKLEIDFIHFDQSSPTVQAFPRLRIALLDWTVAPGHRLLLGQTWDIFAPLNTHTVNLVGNLFQAGNSGFMRHQAGWIGRFDALEVALMVGFQGANTGPSFSNLEQSFTPTGAARITYNFGATGSVGVSGIGSALRFTDPMGGPEQRRAAFGGNVFADLTFGPLNLRAEGYIAQNLANMGALTLGSGRYGVDVADAGGWISGRVTLGEHAVYAMFGGAGVFDPSQVVPGYTPANAMTMTAAAPLASAGPGIDFNLTAHVGYAITPVRGLQVSLEPYLYYTRHHLATADVGRFSADRLALGAQLGATYSF